MPAKQASRKICMQGFLDHLQVSWGGESHAVQHRLPRLRNVQAQRGRAFSRSLPLPGQSTCARHHLACRQAETTRFMTIFQSSSIQHVVAVSHVARSLLGPRQAKGKGECWNEAHKIVASRLLTRHRQRAREAQCHRPPGTRPHRLVP